MHQHGTADRYTTLSHPRGSPRLRTLSQRGAQRVSRNRIDEQDPSGVWREESPSGEAGGGEERRFRVSATYESPRSFSEIFKIRAEKLIVAFSITNSSTRKQYCKDRRSKA